MGGLCSWISWHALGAGGTHSALLSPRVPSFLPPTLFYTAALAVTDMRNTELHPPDLAFLHGVRLRFFPHRTGCPDPSRPISAPDILLFLRFSVFPLRAGPRTQHSGCSLRSPGKAAHSHVCSKHWPPLVSLWRQVCNTADTLS